MLSIDYEFTKKSEGGNKLIGYVPVCDSKSVANKKNSICFGKDVGTVIGKSGVTIGAGFDLGQNKLYDLQQLRLPPGLQIKLMPYLFKIKNDAVDLLQNQPLVISEYEAAIINERKKEAHARILQKRFNTYSKLKFENLSSEVQTVLFSITYQYGINATKTTLYSLWLAALKQDYKEMIKVLKSFETYKDRRNSEAKLIEKMILNTTIN